MIAPKGRLKAFQYSLRMKFVILFGAVAGPNEAYTNARHAPNH